MDHPSSDCARQDLRAFLASYANMASEYIEIDRDPATTTQGAITDPEGRLAPARLAPWKDGSDVLDDIFNCLLTVLEDAEGGHTQETFPSRLHVSETGQALSVINSEAAVHLFDVDTLYKPANKILDAALRRSAIRAAVTPILHRRGYRTDLAPMDSQDVPGEFMFSPHHRTITVPAHIAGHKRKRSDSKSTDPTDTGDHGPEVTEDEINVITDTPSPSLSQASIQPVVRINSENKINLKSGPGDYYCSFVSSSSPPSRRLLLIGEAKAPHKLTRTLIYSALGGNPTIDTIQFMQSAERNQQNNFEEDQRWLAAVATQIYSSLVNSKRRYGYITTGQSYVLLRISPSSPKIIEYLALPPSAPQPEHPVHEREDIASLAATPLSRLICLALLSLFSASYLTEAEHQEATTAESALVWRDARVREQSLESKTLQSTTSAITKSSGDQVWTGQHKQNTHKRVSSEHDEDDNRPTKRPRLSIVSVAHPSPPCLTPPPEIEQSVAHSSMDAVPFCTSRCILSLAHRAEPSTTYQPQDPSCPNWPLHQLHAQTLDLRSLARSSIQLPMYNYDYDNTEEAPILLQRSTENATYADQYGAASALFKVRIQPGGYVLIAKAGRTSDAVQRLKYEERVYRKLRDLQGNAIPVCAGLVDLPRDRPRPPFRFARDFPAFLLLSWAGTSLLQCRDIVVTETERWKESMEVVLKQVHGRGMLHCDAEPRNFVLRYNDNGPSGMRLLDLERAITKGRFTRRARRSGPVTDEKAERDFRQACVRERERCLAYLDEWAGWRRRELARAAVRAQNR
ncbi:hypothetical protein M406DRAFT_74129 [Cryphonectria parasitica EP155]|uniref:Protein kinase domain-containing protein n=1 Tax=Cryphonectria parasitica (strain ATCC 38755 / EP155) TaxID=660469 RepID=A0A9P4XY86_CRYP1|nr:uncharacterized protein M406DRAFT_74129 [Cryphonectria parasitica EP155]KAF3763537.1 hypothetical protein M406DRAFT_74129 [Cryphonectria parasitica EP155]